MPELLNGLTEICQTDKPSGSTSIYATGTGMSVGHHTCVKTWFLIYDTLIETLLAISRHLILYHVGTYINLCHTHKSHRLIASTKTT